MKITFKGTEYDMGTNLRVAYEVQADFNHKPYQEIFAGINTSKIEDQVRVLYASFRSKNKGVVTYKEFLDELLDNWALHDVMALINDLIEGITFNGMTPEQIEKIQAKADGKN